ncbi:MAG: FecR domain-containing protein [Burkholderiaceae bacterium]
MAFKFGRRVSLAVVCTALAARASWADDSGTAKIVHGDVRVERTGGSVPLHVGDPVQEKDRIVVSAGGSAGITLRDDTRISVGPNSTLVINRFNFDSKTQEGDVDTSILSGTMRYITGLVGRLNPGSVRVATKTATIGVRGTDFIVEVAADGE